MQGDELAPSGKNIVARGAAARPPHRRGRDGALNPLKNLRKSSSNKVRPHLLALFGGLESVVMIVGKGRDDSGAQFVGVGMGQLQGGH